MRSWLVVLLPLALIGQDRTGDYSVGGVVVNSATGEPVRNALVTLSSFGPARGDVLAIAEKKTAFSDPGGGFLFTGLAEGSYQISAAKPDFKAEEPNPIGKIIELKSSQTDLRLQLAPLGVIEGKVVDQYGEPVPLVNIVALSVKIEDGLRATNSDRSVSTDDQGYYRLWNLTPGKYYIKAAGWSGGTHSYVGESAGAPDTREGFAPIYAGGARDLDSASPALIAPGTQARADIKIIRERAVKVRGVLGNFTPHQSVKFELLQGNENVAASRSTLNATTGRFEIFNVTPGTYLLRATQAEKALAEAMVTVKDADVNDVALTLAPAVTVNIHGPAGLFCSVVLYSSDGGDPRPLFSYGSATGDTAIENVLPGEYRVEVECSGGGYPTSAMAGNSELLANPKLTILPGVTPAPIEVTAKRGGGALSVSVAVDPMPAEAGILLVPTSALSTGPVMAVWHRPDSPMLLFATLAPGDYLAYAFSHWHEIEFRDPTFLQSLTGGTPVHIDENDKKEITLTSLVK